MVPKIYCVMTSFTKPLTKEACEILFMNAYDMVQNNRRQQSIKGRGYEGIIRTNLKEFVWSSLSVIIFDAYLLIEDLNQDAEVKFAIRPSDVDPELLLQGGSWWDMHSDLSVEEMIEFIQSQHEEEEYDEDSEDSEV